MKKKIKFIIIALIISISALISTVKAQTSYIGYDKKDVLKEFKSTDQKVTDDTNDEGDDFVSLMAEDRYIICFFNEDKICDAVKFVPFEDDVKYPLINNLNTKIIVSDTMWYTYIGTTKVVVELKTSDKGIVYFYFYI